MEINNLRTVCTLGQTRVDLPAGFVALEPREVDHIASSTYAATKAIAAGVMGDKIAVLTGAAEAWLWPTSSLETAQPLERPMVAPILGGIMVLVSDVNGNLIVVPTLDILSQATHAMNNSELQLHTYNNAENDAGRTETTYT